MNLKFKSTEADLKFNIQKNLDILMSNILYITHELDHVKKIVLQITADNATQKQVDDYFDETSHQTDSDTN